MQDLPKAVVKAKEKARKEKEEGNLPRKETKARAKMVEKGSPQRRPHQP